MNWLDDNGCHIEKTLVLGLEKNFSMMLMNSAAFNVTRMLISASHW